ncbi:MAG: rod shape-determining protein MreC [Deltaproteobacteria bacterium]|nr:rod shape-determining protein MreC [Deltaproteobacteria bacterium]
MAAHAQNPQGPASLANRWPMAILGPISQALNYVADGVGSWWTRYFALASAQETNLRLRQTLTRYRQQLVELKETQYANERLASLLKLKEALPEETLAARIVAWDPGPWSQVALIDVGYADGVKMEAAVISPLGLVGRVAQLSAAQAKVLLVTDRASGVDAVIQRNRVNVLVTGLGPGRLELQYAPKAEDIRLGDLVVSSGLDGLFPPGQAIGVISLVDKAGLGPFLRAELRSTVEFSGLREVLVIKDPPKALDWTTLGHEALSLFPKRGSAK